MKHSIPLLALVVAACSTPDATGPRNAADAVRIAEDSLRLAIDAAQPLHASQLSKAGVPLPGDIRWRSGNETIATVTADGLVRAVGPGRTWIEASDAVHADSVTVQTYATFTTIRAGDEFTCGLAGTGLALCWGRGQFGSLGDGRSNDRVRPASVVGGRRFTALDAAAGSACALEGSSLWCWGYNGVGQLGDGTVAQHQAPVHIADTLTLGRLTLGAGTTTCAFDLAVSGVDLPDVPGAADTSTTLNALCWGWNGFGQLLDGGGANARRPKRIAAGRTLNALAPGGYHVCALDLRATAYCWGLGDVGQLGNGATGISTSPVAVAGGHTFVQLVSGVLHTCGLDQAGLAWCWGDNSVGQIGGAASPTAAVPTLVAGGQTFDVLASSSQHTCGLVAGVAWCWGNNSAGQLGRGTQSLSGAPAPVNTPLRFRAISAGRTHTCAIDTEGAAWCWGGNDHGQLGVDSYGPSLVPVKVLGQ